MEEWREIEGHSEYLVSDHGRVRRNLPNSDPLVPDINGSGYQRVFLWRAGERTRKAIAKLVADAFVPNPDALPQINHIDGDKKNNRASNLEWVTRLQNMQHAWRTGLMDGRGTAPRLRKLDNERVREIRQLCKTMSYREVAKRFDVSSQTVSDINRGRTWKAAGARAVAV